MLSTTRPKKLSGTTAAAAAVASVLTLSSGAGAGAVEGMPDTFVGTPAVIAWTTSCCVVLARS